MPNRAPTAIRRGGSFSLHGNDSGSVTFASSASVSSNSSRGSQRSRGSHSRTVLHHVDDALSLGSSNRRQSALNVSSSRSVGSTHSASILREPTVTRSVRQYDEDDVRSVHSLPYSEARTAVVQPNFNSWAPPPPQSGCHPMRIQYCDDASSLASSYIDVTSTPRYKSSSVGHLSVVEEPISRRGRNCCLLFIVLLLVVACAGAFALGMYFSNWFNTNWFNNDEVQPTQSPFNTNKEGPYVTVANVEMDLGRIATNANLTKDSITTWQQITGDAIEREVRENIEDEEAITSLQVLVTLSAQLPLEVDDEEIQLLRLIFDVEMFLQMSDTLLQNSKDFDKIVFDSVRGTFDSVGDGQDFIQHLRQTGKPAFQQTVTVNIMMPVTYVPTPAPTPSSYPVQSFFDKAFEQFLSISASEEFYLVELLTYNDKAEYSDSDDGFATTDTGRDADQIYKNWIIQEVLPSIPGAQLIFEATLLDPSYDEIVIIKYPSGSAFSQSVLQRGEFAEKIRHRQAGLVPKKSLIFASNLLDNSDMPELLRQPPLDIPPYPPTDADYSFIFLHLIQFRERANYPPPAPISTLTGEEAMAAFDSASTPLKSEYGIRAAGWLRVETLAFGSSQIEQIRLEYVPSLQTWGKLVSEEDYTNIWKGRQAALVPETSLSAITKTSTENLPNLYNDN
mmetsp:Transcript_20912/g.31684  ORF Transcript_20912/g.31684 Transcript_20912/m.31684 type:complete len:676 (+) Transcript_20912:53-2080(+)|eukprot:CAMPEP_0194242300 /NCGR_PEP_ID=MMETSP0158-20130606/7877_1 /TAXON_ID=33649 /ORGANISM="Thalassionema nitzschioides, Strain L26-B" /LENGTH=675 /DNA_ID=CAMNT_0038977359 /DNA_START=1 /DNA_END=2028 /DNA_ORIENTATION=-